MKLTPQNFNKILAIWGETHDIYAPKRYAGKGIYSDTDCIRYGAVQTAEEIVFDQKAEYSFKEALLKNGERLFYFTENQTMESEAPAKKPLIFLRSCDLHALTRLDEMYYKNGAPDYYYDRLRKDAKFILMGCSSSFENCFCVSMGTNQCDAYDGAINVLEHGFDLEIKDETLLVPTYEAKPFTPDFVTENDTKVEIPTTLPENIYTHPVWDEYATRCIGCGRCNFVCPTCTCFSMQDIYYKENGKVGERRRVIASCMVDGFSDMAGGHSFRGKKSDRMRYKVLHKIWDYRQKFNHTMCVGCGRCDDVCPEYISFAHIIEKLSKLSKED
ncbi:MAG: anaerobic sulfite reductase subunit AsrA [Eubacteriales bacterium]